MSVDRSFNKRSDQNVWILNYTVIRLLKALM